MLPFKSNIFVNECGLVLLQSVTHTDYRTLGMVKNKNKYSKKNRVEITSCEPFFIKVPCFKLGKWRCKAGVNLKGVMDESGVAASCTFTGSPSHCARLSGQRSFQI